MTDEHPDREADRVQVKWAATAIADRLQQAQHRLDAATWRTYAARQISDAIAQAARRSRR